MFLARSFWFCSLWVSIFSVEVLCVFGSSWVSDSIPGLLI